MSKILSKLAEKVLLIPIVKRPVEKLCLLYAARRFRRHTLPDRSIKFPPVPAAIRMFERVCLFYAMRRLERYSPPAHIMNLEISERNLTDIKRIFDKAGVRFWLAFGTLLGAYRDKAIMPYDEDTDLVMYSEELFGLVCCEDAFGREGFQLGIDPGMATLYRDGEHTDICLFKLDGNKRVFMLVKYDVSAFETFNEIEFLDQKWRTFNEPERWLKYTYGEDWETPVKGKGITGHAYGEKFESA